MRHLLDNSELYIIAIIIAFAVFLAGGINFNRSTDTPSNQTPQTVTIIPITTTPQPGLQIETLPITIDTPTPQP